MNPVQEVSEIESKSLVHTPRIPNAHYISSRSANMSSFPPVPNNYGQLSNQDILNAIQDLKTNSNEATETLKDKMVTLAKIIREIHIRLMGEGNKIHEINQKMDAVTSVLDQEKLELQKENAALKERVKEHREWAVQMLDLAKKAVHGNSEGGESGPEDFF